MISDTQVVAAEAAVYKRHERGFLIKPLIDPIDMRAALEAALSVETAPVTYPSEFDVLPDLEKIADKLHGNDYHLLKSAMLEIIELRNLAKGLPLYAALQAEKAPT